MKHIRVLRILTSSEKVHLSGILILLVAAALTELALISLVGPILELVQSEELNGASRAESFRFAGFATISMAHVLLAIILTASCRFALKFVASSVERSFKFRVSSRLSTSQFEKFVRSGQNLNSSEVLVDLSNLRQITDLVFDPILRLFLETLTASLLIAFLVSSNPFVSMFVLLLLVVITVILGPWIMSLSNRLGSQIRKYEVNATQSAEEMVNFTYETQLFGLQTFFLERFTDFNSQVVRMRAKLNQIYAILPALIEFVAVGFVFLVIYLFTISSTSSAEAVSGIALFSIVALRLLPGAGTIYSAIVRLRFGLTQLPNSDLTERHFAESTLAIAETSAIDSMSTVRISFQNLSFCFANQTKPVISDLSLDISHGEIVGLVGESGSGKTTLGLLTAGLLSPSSGSIHAYTDAGSPVAISRIRRAYVPQVVPLINGSLRQNIGLGRSSNDSSLVDQLIIELGLSSLDRERSIFDNGEIKVSGGERQRLGIARALLMSPQILVLDEITSSLDEQTESEIMHTIHSLKAKTISLFITHRMHLLRDFDRSFQLLNGQLREL